ncbi:hypothetical protein B0I00_2054 [Novosphingobium kunmingense]|uniref:Uncharacterized protein n=1 Tax=Novosphingobium kunmingense TaxID=1211806 RepID=A0A2N0H6A2_9SPHN|nr:hypothetical protein [Novosphingobium kunmingense]PKB14465.1 hypothetical protein B0I00_2054 [Novosphingobium kunmingense]
MPQPRATTKLVSLSALAAALLAPLPAAARDTSERDRAIGDIQDKLGDPRTQEAIGDAMAGMMAAMLDMKAAPFLKAMDRVGQTTGEHPRHRDIPDDATLGDLAGPGARAMPDEVARKAPAMIGAAGAMVGAMGEMLPQLEEAGKRMGDQMRESIDKAARTRRADNDDRLPDPRDGD